MNDSMFPPLLNWVGASAPARLNDVQFVCR